VPRSVNLDLIAVISTTGPSDVVTTISRFKMRTELKLIAFGDRGVVSPRWFWEVSTTVQPMFFR